MLQLGDSSEQTTQTLRPLKSRRLNYILMAEFQARCSHSPRRFRNLGPPSEYCTECPRISGGNNESLDSRNLRGSLAMRPAVTTRLQTYSASEAVYSPRIRDCCGTHLRISSLPLDYPLPVLASHTSLLAPAADSGDQTVRHPLSDIRMPLG